MPSNRAAWQPAKNAQLLEVKSAPYKSPGANELVIKNAAIAINPIDWLIQKNGGLMFTWLKYPFILGCDTAGEVVEVGSNVKTFIVGDRVLSFCNGTDKKVNSSAEGAFQEYVTLRPNITSKIPANISYEQAATIPLGFITAAAGLFQQDQLGLDHPTIPFQKPKDQYVVIWGGSTSVGCNAIQLAVAAGYTVITTASTKNHEYLRRLGASHTFDYNSKTIVKDILAVVNGKSIAGCMTIGDGGAEACMEILDKAKPTTGFPSSSNTNPKTNNKFISMASYPLLKPEPTSLVLPRQMAYFMSWIATFKTKGLLKGIKSNFIFSSSVAFDADLSRTLFEDFLPLGLERGNFVPAPEPMVVGEKGRGVDGIQEALDVQKKGVSAKKVVVTF